MTGQGKADAQIFQGLNGIQAAPGIITHGARVRGKQIRISPLMGAPHPAPELVELREAKFISAIDEYGIGVRIVDAGFDNRGAEQNIEALMIKI